MNILPMNPGSYRIRKQDVVEAAHAHASRTESQLRFGRHRAWLPRVSVLAIPRIGRRLETIDVTWRSAPLGGAGVLTGQPFSWNRALIPVACVLSAEAWRRNAPATAESRSEDEVLVVIGASREHVYALEADLLRRGGVIAAAGFREAADNLALLPESFQRWADDVMCTGEVDILKTLRTLLSPSESPATGIDSPRPSVIPADRYHMGLSTTPNKMDEQTFDKLCRLLRFDLPEAALKHARLAASRDVTQND